ncbi:helix-turn-helix domain-containing protein [Aquisalimonas asiatica]
MTLTEAADHLAISVRTLRRLIERADLPCVQVGRSRRVDPRDLEAYVARQKWRSDSTSPDRGGCAVRDPSSSRALALIQAIRDERG